MTTLYVIEPGARVEKEYGRILVVKHDEVIFSVALSRISELVLVGYTGITIPALNSLLDTGKGLTLINQNGKMRGRLIPGESRNLALRRKQYYAMDDSEFNLEICRAIIHGKLHNSRTFLRRGLRHRKIYTSFGKSEQNELLVNEYKNIINRVKTAIDKDELRGLEGQAAKNYFYVFRQILNSDLSFDKRTRRPPKDPVNALLSLSYTLLANAIFTACEVVGLDPFAGFLHGEKYGRPALVLDLMEEFRTIFSDSVVLSLINHRMLNEKHFENAPPEGIILNKKGMKIFSAYFTNRLHCSVYLPKINRRVTYQKLFEVQARQIRKAIETGIPNYQPFKAK